MLLVHPMNLWKLLKAFNTILKINSTICLFSSNSVKSASLYYFHQSPKITSFQRFADRILLINFITAFLPPPIKKRGNITQSSLVWSLPGKKWSEVEGRILPELLYSATVNLVQLPSIHQGQKENISLIKGTAMYIWKNVSVRHLRL